MLIGAVVLAVILGLATGRLRPLPMAIVMAAVVGPEAAYLGLRADLSVLQTVGLFYVLLAAGELAYLAGLWFRRRATEREEDSGV